MIDSDRHRTLVARATLAVAGLVFVYGLIRLGLHASVALRYPYDLDYGEGVVWEQMRLIMNGSGYEALRPMPAFVFEYPPLYHIVTAATAGAFGFDPLFAGRLVSLVMALAAAVLIGLLTNEAIGGGQDRRVRVIAGLIAGLVFLTLPVVLSWSTLMRVDMLAYALSLAGLLAAASCVERPVLAIVAGTLFTMALYSRQTCLPAPAASFLILLIVRPRAAWLMLAASLFTGLTALALLSMASDGQFLVQILAYNINRVTWNHAMMLVLVLMANIVILAQGAIGATAAWRLMRPGEWRQLAERLRGDTSLTTTAIILLTLVLKTLMLPAILKSGASDNYLIDWFALIAVLIGIGCVPLVRAALNQPARPGLALILLIGIGLPVQMMDPPLWPDYAKAERDRAALAPVVERIRASAKPVVTDEMVLVLRGGQRVMWEPAIVAELGSAGIYDERALAERVRRGEFGFFVTRGDRGSLLFDQRFNPIIADAMDAAYPRRERAGDLTLHLPRE
ncbi:hypothetical protein GCM10009087_33980 [Sphingomonas oligophenolica]|uniref:Glycosyltransferase RgtA/B/C/D-like domain-containing protein n=1 Tax=Sphingomonas oligophenolica TaxID=301154 RepID=A0ABU9XYW6_9SPHN